MSGTDKRFTQTIRQIFQIALICGMVAFLAACAGKDTPEDAAASGAATSGSGAAGEGTKDQGPQDQSIVTSANNHRELVYGIKVNLPQGWVIGATADAGVADDKEIEKHISNGERIGILDIFRTDKSGKEPTGRISLFLVDAKTTFMPEEQASRMTPEACDQLGKMLVQRERELAAKNKAKSPIISWNLSREMINGKLVLVQKGLAQPSEGKVHMVHADFYLPKGAGLAVKSIADAEPGTEAILDAFVKGIQINR